MVYYKLTFGGIISQIRIYYYNKVCVRDEERANLRHKGGHSLQSVNILYVIIFSSILGRVCFFGVWIKLILKAIIVLIFLSGEAISIYNHDANVINWL